MKLLSLLFLIIVLSVETEYAQLTETKGNILRIDINKPEIDLSDTLGSWFDKKEGPLSSTNYITRILNNNDTNYIFGVEGDYHDYLTSWGRTAFYFYNENTKEKIFYFGLAVLFDVIWEPYLSIDNDLLQIENGNWFSFGIRGNCFIDREDSVYEYRSYFGNEPLFTSVIGKVKDHYLLAVKRDTTYPTYDYYIANLSNSPKIQFISQIKLNYNHEDFDLPSRIEQVNDSLYLLKNEISTALYLANLNDSTLTIIKELKNNFYYSWIFQDNTLFYTEFNGEWNFIKEEFDLSSLTFINKEIILDRITGYFRYDNNYFVTLSNDSLTVYNYQLRQIVNQYNLTNIKYKDSFILSSPYIYLHQILTITDVNNENAKPTQFTLYQNYPNPFNPSTTVSYELKEASYVTLKIYDILGKEVTTLVNQYQQPGKYNSQFSISQTNGRQVLNSQLSSGVYFYVLRVRDSSSSDKPESSEFQKMKKMILLR
ncbi:MAG: T9SS type A sorting domain-containing protein [Bacteroidota bacterium]